jgi:hypothetical protein
LTSARSSFRTIVVWSSASTIVVLGVARAVGSFTACTDQRAPTTFSCPRGASGYRDRPRQMRPRGPHRGGPHRHPHKPPHLAWSTADVEASPTPYRRMKDDRRPTTDRRTR